VRLERPGRKAPNVISDKKFSGRFDGRFKRVDITGIRHAERVLEDLTPGISPSGNAFTISLRFWRVLALPLVIFEIALSA